MVMGDINAHMPHFELYKINKQGKILHEIMETRNSIILNDGLPTFIPPKDKVGHVLDLIKATAGLAILADSCTLPDNYVSDHRVVLADFPLTTEKSCLSTHRLSLNKVDWRFFREVTDNRFPVEQIEEFQLELHDNLKGKYDDFVRYVRGALETAGAYIPKATGDRSSVRPTWWSSKCDAARTKNWKCAVLIAGTRTHLIWNCLLARRRIALGYCLRRGELLAGHYVTPYPLESALAVCGAWSEPSKAN